MFDFSLKANLLTSNSLDLKQEKISLGGTNIIFLVYIWNI